MAGGQAAQATIDARLTPQALREMSVSTVLSAAFLFQFDDENGWKDLQGQGGYNITDTEGNPSLAYFAFQAVVTAPRPEASLGPAAPFRSPQSPNQPSLSAAASATPVVPVSDVLIADNRGTVTGGDIERYTRATDEPPRARGAERTQTPVCMAAYPDVKVARRFNRWRRNAARFERRITPVVLARVLSGSGEDAMSIAMSLQIPADAVRNIVVREILCEIASEEHAAQSEQLSAFGLAKRFMAKIRALFAFFRMPQGTHDVADVSTAESVSYERESNCSRGGA
ncbi:MAG TPA: hypothetical protein VG826_33260 [Pirellulales bacterium]|nr:hypothetical protein [Pirellulales bacterium]